MQHLLSRESYIALAIRSLDWIKGFRGFKDRAVSIRAIRVISLIRDSELVRHKHQIKNVHYPISVHIPLQPIRP